MPLTHPFNLPTLEETFGDNIKLMSALKRARFQSVVPVMELPREVLREFYGIGPSTSVFITRALAAQGLAHHRFCERLSTFIDEQFGCIEDAPVATLEVVTIHDMYASRQVYAPLALLHFLERLYPNMTIMDLSHMTEQDVREIVNEHEQLGPIRERVAADLEEIGWRLQQWYPKQNSFGIAARQQPHLRAVGQ